MAKLFQTMQSARDSKNAIAQAQRPSGIERNRCTRQSEVICPTAETLRRQLTAIDTEARAFTAWAATSGEPKAVAVGQVVLDMLALDSAQTDLLVRECTASS